MALVVIGEKDKRSNNSVLSGDAYKEGTATANYADSFFDLGFMSEQITIHNDGGADLDVKFMHQKANERGDFTAPEAPANGVRQSSKIEISSSMTFRKRNHRYIAVKGDGAAFRIEAW
jgi:hypothetical protein